MQSEIRMLDRINGCHPRETVLGYVETKETTEHKVTYETASWYTLVNVSPGKYEVVLHEYMGSKCVLVKYKGLITKEHFVNRLFTASSISEPTNHIGTERSCSAQMYDYSAAQEFATNPRWVLVDDYNVVMRQNYFDSYNPPLPYKSYKLVKLDA